MRGISIGKMFRCFRLPNQLVILSDMALWRGEKAKPQAKKENSFTRQFLVPSPLFQVACMDRTQSVNIAK
jgi:hypothetical protein